MVFKAQCQTLLCLKSLEFGSILIDEGEKIDASRVSTNGVKSSTLFVSLMDNSSLASYESVDE